MRSHTARATHSAAGTPSASAASEFGSWAAAQLLSSWRAFVPSSRLVGGALPAASRLK